MNTNLLLLSLCQGLFLTNNVTFIAINGLVGLSMAPLGWMATLPVMGYVVGGALSTGLVSRSQQRFGRKLNLTVKLAPELIGGIRVVVGDEVLDTSVKARLDQMKVALTA